MKNKIFYTTLCVSILSIILILLPVLTKVYIHNEFHIAAAIINPLQLEFQFVYFHAVFETDTQYQTVNVNLMTLFLYIFLLTGTIQYYLSNETEFKLVRFCLSIIFIFHLGFSLVYFFGIIQNEQVVNIIFIIKCVSTIAQIFLSYRALLYFNQLKTLIPDTKTLETKSLTVENNERVSARDILNNSLNSESKAIEFELASKGSRLLHLLIDSIVLLSITKITLMVLYQNTFIKYLFDGLENTFGEYWSSMIVFILLRIMYYAVFEIILNGMTPGKMITESRVIASDGSKLNANKVFKRTLLRFIPFEPLSFLGKRGWHDEFSNTAVVQESKGSLNTRWIILLFVIISILLVAIKIYYLQFYTY